MSSDAGGHAGRGVRVAVIDSGVFADHPHVGGVAGGVSVGEDGSLGDDFVDRLGHGTAVAGAIREKAPLVELYAVRIFDRSLVTSAPTLLAALRWAIRSGMHVINLSLGTANPRHEDALRAVVEEAAAAGAVIVAARDEGDVRWWPGCLPGVVSVRADAACPRETFEIEPELPGAVYRTSPYPRPIPGVPPERNLNGVSFAVANMTGFLARALPVDPARCSLADAILALDALKRPSSLPPAARG